MMNEYVSFSISVVKVIFEFECYKQNNLIVFCPCYVLVAGIPSFQLIFGRYTGHVRIP